MKLGMKIKSIYHFLGGIKFAIFLITMAALFVIAGTLIESKTESHKFAAKFTYDSPLFFILILGFFINILFSATRRFPFKFKHIPFLITHLGLLMILSGVMVKNQFGTQGTLFIKEGAGIDEIFIADSYAIYVEDEKNHQTFNLRDDPLKFKNLNFKVLNQYPHSKKTLETWFKGDVCAIFGLKPIHINDLVAINPISVLAKIAPKYPEFEIMAFRVNGKQDTLQLGRKLYLKDIIVSIKQKNTCRVEFEAPLSELLENHSTLKQATLDFQENKLTINFNESEILISLNGEHALENQNRASPYSAILKQKPTLLLIQDSDENINIYVYDKDGRIHAEPSRLNGYIAYNRGFHGYGAQFEFPLNPFSLQEIENWQMETLNKQLETSTIAPLKLLYEGCKNENLGMAKVFTEFLNDADSANLPKLDWSHIPKKEHTTCCWIARLIPPLEKKAAMGLNCIQLLKSSGWPLIHELEQSFEANGIKGLTDELIAQIYALSEQLPEITPVHSNALFEAYLKLYGINTKEIITEIIIEQPKVQIETVTIETPLTQRIEKATPHQKLEDNLPLVHLALNRELMTLSYDKFASELKWPTSNGEYLLRYQSKIQSIPYRLRLRNARQIHYPGSNANFSFEADLIVTDKKNSTIKEVTISMNNVHETWDGYRFYLSNISPGVETSIQTVQIVVNHDPAKYFLTYPGAMILSLGIFLLFFMPKRFFS